MRYFTLLLLLLCSPSWAAITFVACSNTASSSATSLTPTEPTGTAEDDLVLIFAHIDSADGTFDDLPPGSTNIDNDELNGDNTQESVLSYIVRGASPPADWTVGYSGTAAPMRASLCTFRGINTSTPFAVSYDPSNPGHWNTCTGDATCAAPAISGVANGDWVVILFNSNGGAFDATPRNAPTGYTMALVELDNANRHQAVAYKAISSSGTETPGAWDFADTGGSPDPHNFTVALNPAVSSTAGAIMRRRRQ